ncbi:hypothetical protein [Methanoculleus caldifontis]|uniref:hypothetical protein n=1 Tax=Methanoculleus caldifontis TaxID=2651577 RepID=UPI0029373CCF|nr:hypothetical protein [Methanoculleus sp. Wushi-C6]
MPAIKRFAVIGYMPVDFARGDVKVGSAVAEALRVMSPDMNWEVGRSLHQATTREIFFNIIPIICNTIHQRASSGFGYFPYA